MIPASGMKPKLFLPATNSFVKNKYKLGVSFSVKCARDFSLEPLHCLQWLLEEIGVRRFRLMSYWDQLEPVQGQFDWQQLDSQFAMIEKYQGEVTLSVGLRQPRYPECHPPDWLQYLSSVQKDQSLMLYLSEVVKRYKRQPVLHSWQLENEALNRGIGECTDYNRQRLRYEYKILKSLDAKHPVVMTLSNTFGLPVRKPTPDVFATTYYKIQYNNNAYRESFLPPWFYRHRALVIGWITGKPSFIHELQAEPWGPRGNPELSIEEQNHSMNAEQLIKCFNEAKQTGLYPIDFWGAEWWYWRLVKHGDPSLGKAAKAIFANLNQQHPRK
jgi:hypothetical protein